MHHPQPQHPPSTRRYINTGIVDGYSSTHNPASNFQRSQQVPSEESHQPQENVEQQQYAMSVHPPMPPSLEIRTPEISHGFQVSAARFPVGSPTFALRPVTAPFSHIEYPNVSPAQSQISDGYDSEQQDPIATVYNHIHSRDHSYSDRQPTYEETGLGFGYSELQKPHNLRIQPRQTSSERSRQEGQNFGEATQQMERLRTVRPQVRRRVRGDSNSSAASMWSSAAVAGDPTYRNEVFFDDVNVSVPYGTQSDVVPPSDQFQSNSAPNTYSYNNIYVSSNNRYGSATNAIVQDNLPSSPATGMEIDPPIIIPPAPRPDELELGDPDHPFTYQGTHWDVSNGAFSVASTDADAASLHSQDRPSSRDSSEPTRGNQRGRKARSTASPAASEQRKASGEGRRKTVMACHFCRFRKLRCDGGHPCTHCMHRDKECTYDATIRRRGPGRRNKSAQETALVQLANRQREEAAREAVAQKEAKHTHGGSARSKAPKEDTHKDACSQTSPQTNQFPASFSNVNTAPYLPDARTRLQFPTPDDSPTGRQEYQAFSTPCGSAHQQELEVPRLPREITQQTSFVRQYQLEEHRRAVSGPLASGLQTPVSQGSPSFYTGSPDRASSQYYPPSATGYPSNRYSIATTQGGDSIYSHTDAESVYAYSEGANVLPYGYQQEQHEPRQQQPDMQGRFRPTAAALQYRREADGDSRMMNTYNDERARMEVYGGRR